MGSTFEVHPHFELLFYLVLNAQNIKIFMKVYSSVFLFSVPLMPQLRSHQIDVIKLLLCCVLTLAALCASYLLMDVCM
jgi:hypothetical protein